MYKEAVIENIGMERYEEVMLELKDLRKEEEKYKKFKIQPGEIDTRTD
jgi:hypothetical protein